MTTPMDRPAAKKLRIGAWRVNPASGQISRPGEVVTLEARTMRLLLCLAERAGEVVSMEEMLKQVWPGVIVTHDSVYQAIASLRRQLGDDAKEPAYIATVPRLGYRMLAAVGPWEHEPIAPTGPAPTVTRAPGWRRMVRALPAAAAALCFALVVVFVLRARTTNTLDAAVISAAPAKSIAVLPFLDLTTQQMDEEYFADGMTEELIDRLSKVPGLRVPAPASSFYFKGKNIPVPEIAKSLGVVYVLFGSVRESDATLRIAVRLIRAENGYVIWSETYDRPTDDKLLVQEQIATEVTKALQAAII
jgi:TolB-like protein/DNA-binding winged helix-turn-helix (wHTH) protein